MSSDKSTKGSAAPQAPATPSAGETTAEGSKTKKQAVAKNGEPKANWNAQRAKQSKRVKWSKVIAKVATKLPKVDLSKPEKYAPVEKWFRDNIYLPMVSKFKIDNETDRTDLAALVLHYFETMVIKARAKGSPSSSSSTKAKKAAPSEPAKAKPPATKTTPASTSDPVANALGLEDDKADIGVGNEPTGNEEEDPGKTGPLPDVADSNADLQFMENADDGEFEVVDPKATK